MGARAKITPPQVYIIGLVLCIISAVSIYFALIKPAKDSIEANTAAAAAAQQIADKLPDDKKDRIRAHEEVALANVKWGRYDREYMPDIDITNLLLGIQQLWHEQVDVLGPDVERYLRADHNVEVVQDGITIPAPPSDPNAVAKKAFTYDLGTVSVVGTFTDVLNSAARWNKFNRLVLVDNFTLAGNSPRLVGQYSLRCFEFTHGAKPGDTIPQAAGSSGGGGSGAPGSSGSFEVGGGPGGPGGDMGAPGGRPGGGPPSASIGPSSAAPAP